MSKYKNLKKYVNSLEKYEKMKFAFRRTAIHLNRHFYLDNLNNDIKIEELFYNISNDMINLSLIIQKKVAKWEIINKEKDLNFSSKVYENNTIKLSNDIKNKKYFSNEVKFSSDLEGEIYKQKKQNEIITFNLLSKKIIDIKTFEEFIISVLKSNSISPTNNLYRKKQIYLTNGIESRHEAIDYGSIQSKLNLLITKINSDETIFDVIFTHFIFEYIHPLDDCNGRVGRMLLLNLLISNKILPKTVLLFLSKSIKNEKDNYYNSFKLIQSKFVNGDVTNGIEIMLNYIIKSIDYAIDNEIKLNYKRKKYIKEIENKIKEKNLKNSIQRNKLIEYLLELELYEYSHDYFSFENIFKEMKFLFPKYTKQNFKKNIEQLTNTKILIISKRYINQKEIDCIKLNLS